MILVFVFFALVVLPWLAAGVAHAHLEGVMDAARETLDRTRRQEKP